MALESQILINNYGLTEEFAESLLNFTERDVESAIRILETSEKDVMVIKGKFLSSKRLSYGAFILFYNFQTNIPEYLLAAITTDNNLSKIKLETEWAEYIDSLLNHLKGTETDHDNSSRLEAEILSSENIPYITSFFIDPKNVDMVNLKRFLLNTLNKVLLDSGLVLKIAVNNIDVFKFKNILKTLKSGLKIIPKEGKDIIMLLKIVCEPVLAPIGGVDIEKILVGQEILVKIHDDRDIVRHIANIAGFSDETGVIRPVFAKVVRNEKSEESDNNKVNVEFGPGIYGAFIVGSKIRVQANKEAIHKEAQQQQQQQHKSGIDNEAMRKINDISNFDKPRFSDSSFPKSSFTQTEEPKTTKKGKIFLIINVVIILLVTLIVFLLILFM
jgi:hypothetical protein